ncbi:MAG: hypothetical protein EBQ95_01840 [Gammaproteobacteria bacterium]|nr:hypothetical protein [Gammaproteobacteria bacterium]
MQNQNVSVNEKMLADLMHHIVSHSTSSHDIIPRQLMPTISLLEIPRRREQFGDAAMRLYLSHLAFCRQIQSILTQTIHQSDAFSRLSLLMITMYKMGVGESHALVTMMYTELVKLRFVNFFSVMLLNPVTEKGHAIILIGEHLVKTGDVFPAQFLQLSDDVILVDPLLSFIGQANQYAVLKADYLSKFNYTQIMAVQPGTLDHLSFIRSAERRADELVAELKTRYGLTPFISKSLLSLAKTGYDCQDVTIVKDAPILTELRKTELDFFGVQKPNQEMDAVCSADSRLEVLKASGLAQKISIGRFHQYKDQHRFFIIPNVNSPEVYDDIVQKMNPSV